MIRHLLLILALLLLPVPVTATVYTDCTFDSAPSSEDDGGVYTCGTGTLTLHFGSNLSGSVFDHVTGSACYGGSGGCAKFYSHTTGGNSYREMYLNSAGAGSQRNIRFLIKFEGNYFTADYSGKWCEEYPFVHLDLDYSWRTYLAWGGNHGCGQTTPQPELSYDGTLFMLHGQGETSEPCGEYYWCYNSSWGEGWPANVSSCTISHSHINLADYTGQWISIELEHTSSGTYKVYLDTQDGLYSGLYYWLDTTFSNTSVHGFSDVGAYLEGSEEASENKYFILDNVVHSDSYIGPPAGFSGQIDSTAYGHVTGVTQPTTATFASAWTGNGTITGTGDNETITVTGSQYMATAVLNTGVTKVTLSQNVYRAGETGVLKYRTCSTDSTCTGAWTTYTVPFDSLGYIQLRVEAP